MPDFGGPVNLLGLVPLGIAIWLAVQILYSRVTSSTTDFIRLTLNIVAGTFLVVGILAMFTTLAGLAAIFAIIAFVFNVGLAELYYARVERQAVLNYLCVAIERHIPLTIAARAYALERNDWLGRRSLRLAAALEAGGRLPSALPASGHRFGLGPRLAVGVGDDLGCLEFTLRQAMRNEEHLREILRSWTQLVTYVASSLAVVVVIVGYLAVVVFPRMSKILDSYDLQLSPLTNTLFDVTNNLSQGPEALMVFALCGLAVLGLLTFAFLTIFELRSRRLPILGRISMTHDRAWILRAMSWGFSNNRSMLETLTSIEHHFPASVLRPRLAAAVADIRNGTAWPVALRSNHVFDSAQIQLLEAAERVGNLAWACEQRSDSLLRWFQQRLNALCAFMYPCFTILLAIVVGACAMSVFSYLAELMYFNVP